MKLEDGLLLRVYVGESDRLDGEPMYKWLVDQAHAAKLAGATVLRGMEGYGGDGRIHTARVIRLSTDLPLVVEMVDSVEKIEAFLPIVENAMSKGVVTVEKVRMRLYAAKKSAAE
jgi:PII-like signaling protein